MRVYMAAVFLDGSERRRCFYGCRWSRPLSVGTRKVKVEQLYECDCFVGTGSGDLIVEMKRATVVGRVCCRLVACARGSRLVARATTRRYLNLKLDKFRHIGGVWCRVRIVGCCRVRGCVRPVLWLIVDLAAARRQLELGFP